MKQNESISNPITQPLLRDLVARDQANRTTPLVSSVQASLPTPSISMPTPTLPEAAEFDQDAGGGYNDDGTFPQE